MSLGNMIFLVGFACLYIYITGIFAVAVARSAKEWSTLYLLSHSKTITEAEVQDIHTEFVGKAIRVILKYRFAVADIPYEGAQQIARRKLRHLQHAHEVQVCYLAQNPKISRLWGKDYDNTERNLYSYVAFAAFLVMPFHILTFIFCWLYMQYRHKGRGAALSR